MRARVTLQLLESLNSSRRGQPSMWHKRAFLGARSDQILSVLFGLTFCGKGGLMIDSTAEQEEATADGCCRFITGFRPLGNSFGSFLGGSFNVRQELIDCSRRTGGVVATIQMSFSPCNQRDKEPTGAFLCRIEPGETVGNETLAFWIESINTDETASLGVPELRIKASSQWAFRFGHNRLMQKAALRIVDVLNKPDDRGTTFADYARDGRLNFWPVKCGTREPQ